MIQNKYKRKKGDYSEKKIKKFVPQIKIFDF
jgi:hypothetical protein